MAQRIVICGGRRASCAERVAFQLLAAKTLPTDVEDGCRIEEAVERADIQLVAEAFKQYAKLKEKNIPLLSAYAERLNVKEKVRSYLEVLL